MIHYCLTIILWAMAGAAPQQSQNPSPMVEHTRAHPRLKQSAPPGRRETLEVGTLFIPEKLEKRKGAPLPLVVHFHGAPWLSETAAAGNGRFAVIAIQLGAGSSVYARPFKDPALLQRLLDEAERKAGRRFTSLTLTAWSAGYGAIREILRVPDYFHRVDRVLLIDGLHAGYLDGKPGPQESTLETADLDVFLSFAREATEGRKQMIVTHSEIFPGTFASTTETADWLLAQLGLKRKPVVKWGPMGTQQLSEVRQGNLLLRGYAGNSAPDHVDQFHSLPEYLRWLR